MTMNPEIKAQWITDLRSGEFNQARSALHTNLGYCCLGVLCDQAVRAGVINEPVVAANGHRLYGAKVSPNSQPAEYLLPKEVQRWAGFTGTRADSPHVHAEGESWAMSHLNDYMGYDFRMIADALEADEEI